MLQAAQIESGRGSRHAAAPGALLAAILLATTLPGYAQTRVDSGTFLTSDGVRLHVLEAGPASSRPVLAFVPGWSMPGSVWRAQLASLSARHRVAVLDPRGQGESEVPTRGYGAERRAQDLAEFLARYSSVVLVAWSLGALEALEFIRLHGESRLAGLVLVDSSVGEPPVPASASGFIDSLRGDRRKVLADFVAAVFGSSRTTREVEEITDAAMRMRVEDSIELLAWPIPREHWRDIARGVKAPLLYVVTPQFAEQADSLKRNRPGTETALFEKAGHALFATEPTRFNALLESFVSRLVSKR